MKKQILFAGLICLSLINSQFPAKAGFQDWYKKHDHNKDGKWDYNEYVAAQREWEKHHHREPMSEKELREYYEQMDKNKDGYVSREESRHWHRK